jgi:hypothetical protein
MGQIRKLSDVKLFTAIMYRRDADPQTALEPMISAYGDIDATSTYGPVEFSWSHYYKEEMGDNLLKYYAFFKTPIDRSRLPSVKNHTNAIERQFMRGGKRTVNIDPGYLTVDKLVLASTKDFFHRLYLGDGIFGEATLHYRKTGRKSGGFRFFSWTYPDYQEPEFLKFLETARESLGAGE